MTAFKNQLKTILLLGALSALVVGLGALVAPGYLYLFGVLALAMNLGAYFAIPGDRAVGYEAGDCRGLMWVELDRKLVTP